MVAADIAQKIVSFTLFGATVYLTGDLLYRINKRKKTRIAELAVAEQKAVCYNHFLTNFK